MIPQEKKTNSEMIVHRAPLVVFDPWTVRRDAYIAIQNNRIVETGIGIGPKTAKTVVFHDEKVLIPGLVNAHTHLELSGLKNKTRHDGTFIDWIRSVIKAREVAISEMDSDARKGTAFAARTGTVFLADTSSEGKSRRPFLENPMPGIWFREYIGGMLPESFAPSTCADKSVSLAAHAPHTCFPETIRKLKAFTRKFDLPFSIHVAESMEECQFIETGSGPFSELFEQRGIDTAKFRRASSPVRLLDEFEVLDKKILLVHMVFGDRHDFGIISEKGCRVCICPRSNWKLVGKLPDIHGMLAAGIQPALGTDSLASNDSLNIFDEMVFLKSKLLDLSPENIFAMATCWGAEALGKAEYFGKIVPGLSGSIISVPVESTTPQGVIEEIVSKGYSEDQIEVIGRKV